jgi:hypothetical protein
VSARIEQLVQEHVDAAGDVVAQVAYLLGRGACGSGSSQSK